jgi:hypothetical protein
MNETTLGPNVTILFTPMPEGLRIQCHGESGVIYETVLEWSRVFSPREEAV